MVPARDIDVIWLEERSFVFDCIVRVLRSRVTTDDDPLAVLAMALLFHNLGDNEARDIALSRVEDELRALPDILDSGLQLRDCLTASGYYYAAGKAQRDMLAVDHIVLPRINFASTNEWFRDSGLATIVALISDEVQAGIEAKQYLRRKADTWLHNDYVLGMTHYCLVVGEQYDDQIGSHLSKRDWSNDTITTLSWGLLALGKLRRRGYEIYTSQSTIARLMLDILGNSTLVQNLVAGKANSDSLTTGPLTSSDLAFAAYALNNEGFDGIVGVRRDQKEALTSLLNLQRILARGGHIMTKGWLTVFQASFIGFLVMILWELLRFAGIAVLLQVVIEVIFMALLAAVAYWISKKGLPSTGAASVILGDASRLDHIDGETHEHED